MLLIDARRLVPRRALQLGVVLHNRQLDSTLQTTLDDLRQKGVTVFDVLLDGPVPSFAAVPGVVAQQPVRAELPRERPPAAGRTGGQASSAGQRLVSRLQLGELRELQLLGALLEECGLANAGEFLLLFDLSFVTPAELNRAREAASSFVSQAMGPSDLAAVASVSAKEGPKMLSPFHMACRVTAPA